MQRIAMLLVALAVPVAFAQSACSDSDRTGRGTAGAHGTSNNDNDPNHQEDPSEEEDPGEGPGEGPMEDAGTPGDTSGGGGNDTGTTPPPPPNDTGTTPPPPPPPRTMVVDVNSNFFAPRVLTIRVGDTVRWEFEASGHTVTSGGGCSSDGMFDSGLRSDGATFSQTFTAAGSYDYHCVPHCSEGMTGTIVVED